MDVGFRGLGIEGSRGQGFRPVGCFWAGQGLMQRPFFTETIWPTNLHARSLKYITSLLESLGFRV